MKRFWIIGALVALLSSCTESAELENAAAIEPDEVVGGIEISATISLSEEDDELTKVSNDGVETLWLFSWDAEDSEGNVFAYCKVGDTPTYKCV